MYLTKVNSHNEYHWQKLYYDELLLLKIYINNNKIL